MCVQGIRTNELDNEMSQFLILYLSSIILASHPFQNVIFLVGSVLSPPSCYLKSSSKHVHFKLTKVVF